MRVGLVYEEIKRIQITLQVFKVSIEASEQMPHNNLNSAHEN